MAETIVVTDTDGVRAITLNRPSRLNAINLDMIERLHDAIADAQDDDAVRCVLLRGAGRAFCAGDDVEAQSEICEQGEAALRDQLRCLQRISELLVLGPKPAVAAVRGWAVGAGFSWVLNCDFRVWSESACGFFPEVSFGTFVTGGATCLLGHLVGPTLANDLLLRGTKFRADAARERGLVQSLHSECALDAAAEALAGELASLPQLAAQSMKQVLSCGFADQFRAALAAETEACVATTLDPVTLARMGAAVCKT